MGNTNNIPKIRFKGFTDAWEQRKLGEVGKARSGVGFPDIEQGGTSGTPFFKVSDMNNDGNENEMNVANNYVTDAQIVARRWSPIEEVPAIFFAKVGAAVMLNRKRLCRFPFLLDNNTMAYSLDKDLWDADFAKALFETVDLTLLVQVGALPSYNAGDVEAMEIMLPEVSEQHQIGTYFRQLDALITLHQRKLEKILNYKKAMLDKMFPKNGSTYPEVRFKGFDDAWEQRKVSRMITDIADGPFGSNLKTEHYTEEKEARIIQLSNLSDYGWQEENTRYTTFEHAKKIKRCIVNEGELIMGKMMPAGMTIMRPNTEKMYVLSSDCVRIKLDNDIAVYKFFLYTTKSDSFLNQVNNDSQGSTRVRTSISKIRDMNISIPSVAEQERIGEYFTNLDNLITLHQRKLEKLKNIKKSMLEKMFV